ncbi:MAG: XrtA-associated tyrosine autokinase [Candidatus Thiodiazotropha taylori]|nr:XrtA-associated tyrosine autokinase [Candidatus Thiodiazotropha taylori]MCG7964788.1 XrtA-associated tyrosine autokinase [Candidatus Thiodiazotropha endolucinida]MCG7911166.1 XrtA-associated tyrosine autokinase [Candidatus Thiodiazotropha taylori]MCG7927792.1 XrtA-associated tyrosine autokinase [Candidatus Thiodiazotropha taylori]MCG7928086.1 XrtA-associated tyrosine autokinase [Candidatus Thiodiazotropha taylori]
MSSIEKAIERLEKSKAEKKSVDRSAVEVEPEKTATPEAAPSETVAASQPVEEKVSAAAEEKASPAVEETVNESIEEAKRINLDYEALSSNGFIVPHSGNKQLSEEYRIIKRPLIRNALGKGAAPITHGNLVSIASSLPSEGKTFTAMNLALSIATELDTTVLLIDGDVLKYSLSRLLGIQNEPGLIDLLSQKECNVSDVIIHTQIPRLKLIAAGHRSEKSTELLASKEMERLLDELSNRYSDRIIIFDSSPILATSEAAVLNQHMGQILLVVEAGETPVDAIKDSLSRLDQEKAIGLVLNKSREDKGSNYYGTYY